MGRLGSLKKIILAHKILTALITLGAVFGGYKAYSAWTGTTNDNVSYYATAVTKGTIISAVTGSGQVSASNQIDLKPKASGNISKVYVLDGDTLKAGALIAQIDARDALKAVRDAQANLEAAQITLEKLKQPADTLALIQAQNAITQAKQAKTDAANSLAKAYDDGFNAVANSFIDLPGIVSSLDNILNTTTLNGNQTNAYAYSDIIKAYHPNAELIRDAALNSYIAARAAYDKNTQDYKNTSLYADTAAKEAIVNETYNTVQTVSQAVKDTKNLLDGANDALQNVAQVRIPPILTTHESNLQTYTASINNRLTDLLNIKNTISNSKDTAASSERTIIEKTEALNKLQKGADPLDLQSQQLTVKQRQNALLDAQENLADYSIRAPFDGMVAKVNIKKGDPVSSGVAAVTYITQQKLAQISLNEIDAAKVKNGQKTTLKFDAVPDLSISGEIISVDTVGTVTQGVVTYSIKIGFDTQDDRVKPGMSVSASIVTAVKQDVIMVPNSAIKSRGSVRYVQVFDGDVPQGEFTSADMPHDVSVETGAANDVNTEIISGLNEGDNVVTRTLNKNTAAPSGAPTLFGTPRIGGGGGGGGVRAR